MSWTNNAGDFDQLSFAGVDYGADFTQDYGCKPNNLEGDMGMYDSQQMGYDANQMGIVPEGMGEYVQSASDFGADYNQLGIVPSGMGDIIPSGLGHGYYDQMGGSYQQLGAMPAYLSGSFNIPVINVQVPKLAVYGLAGVVGLMFAGVIPKPKMLRKFGM